MLSNVITVLVAGIILCMVIGLGFLLGQIGYLPLGAVVLGWIVAGGGFAAWLIYRHTSQNK